MQRRLQFWTTALLAALLIRVISGAASAQQAQQIDGRTLMLARQEIRAELAAAVSKGELTRQDQYRILLHAKESLPPEDVEGLMQTMDRLAAKNPPSAAGPVVQVAASGGAAAIPGAPTGASLSYEQAGAAAPSGLAPQADGSTAVVPGSPFELEHSGQPPVGAMNDSMMFSDQGGSLFGPGDLKDNLTSVWQQTWRNASFTSDVEAFKGPVDFLYPNGNFGVGFGMNAGIPISQEYGIGVQVGLHATVTDWQGTLSAEGITDTPTSQTRRQWFSTIGLFQRLPFHGMTATWGFVHDWLQDEYYSNLHFAQWRVKLGLEWNPFNEAGIWASLHDHGDATDIALAQGQPFTIVNYQPLAQGSLYWRHVWYNAATTTTWIGVAQEPGDLGLRGRGADSADLPLFAGGRFHVHSAPRPRHRRPIGRNVERFFRRGVRSRRPEPRDGLPLRAGPASCRQRQLRRPHPELRKDEGGRIKRRLLSPFHRISQSFILQPSSFRLSLLHWPLMARTMSELRLFFQEFRRNFHTTGAILPSGRCLAKALARFVAQPDGQPRRILEIGPGTGAVTQRLVSVLGPHDRLDLVELNASFVDCLRRRFESEPAFVAVADRCRVLHLPVEELPGEEKYHLIVSGLPLNNFAVEDVRRIWA